MTDSKEAADKVRKWSTQSRERAAWYQHEELGYNYRMSNVIAGVVRNQIPHLEEHIAQKKAIYMRYKEGLKDLPVQMNPYDEKNSDPNFWLSCMIIDKDAMCKQVRGEQEALYVGEHGKSCPTEILEAIASINAEGRPIWKPMHSLYLTYLPKEKFKYAMKMNVDARGSFTELVHTVDCGQVSINISKPGITKGQHWHNSKWELFIVVHGHGMIQERNINTGELVEFEVSGERIEAVHMIPGWTHNIINLSDTEDLVTVMTCNEVFDPNRPDTFGEPV